MMLNNGIYVPALRWRLGEYQALLRLSDRAKDRIVPFITIPEIEFDFEEWRPKKSVQEHVHPFAARYKSKWNKRQAWIGVHKSIVEMPVEDGRDIFSFVFGGLRKFEANAVPVIPLSANPSTVHAIQAIVKQDDRGVAVSVRLEDLMKEKPASELLDLSTALGAELSDIDLIVDLGAPNFQPYEAFSSALIMALQKLGDLHAYRNLILICTAIPNSFKDIAKGSDEIVRHDWLFYQALIANLPYGMRRPNFGDYTIVHPEFAPLDMRKIKSAGKIIYTTQHSWVVRKGGAFRDDPEQMHRHCAEIVGRPTFKGAEYSNGDEYIAKCAVGLEGPSNQTRWKNVAINHHITLVIDDLARLGDAA